MDNTWYTEAIRFLFSLGLAATTGVIACMWGRRRDRERDLFLLWRNAFDRAAFRGSYQHHANREQFRRAIATTIKAIATGKLFDSPGRELDRVEGVYHGPSQIRNKKRRGAILEVRNRLQKIFRLSYARAEVCQLDDERDAIIRSLNGEWKKLGIETMPLPSTYQEPDDIAALMDELQEES